MVRSIPVAVPLGAEDGMPAECVVNADDIVTIPVALLFERVTRLSADKTTSVETAVKFALDLP